MLKVVKHLKMTAKKDREKVLHMSRDMRFPTMWYMRPAKPQISIRILTEHHLEFLRLKGGEHHLEFLRLKGGGKGSSESTLVKMLHCWKSQVAAKLYIFSSDIDDGL